MMWTWTLNWGQIRDDIVVGSCPRTTADLDRFREQVGITAMLSLQTDLCREALGIDYEAHQHHGERLGLVLVNAPMRDFDAAEQRIRLPDAVRALHRLLDAGHTVYVHCTAGINRAPLTVLAYLTFVEGMTTKEAMKMIVSRRPEAQPYWEPYDNCWQDLVARHRESIRLRARELSQRFPDNTPEHNWFEAEQVIIRETFIAGLRARAGEAP